MHNKLGAETLCLAPETFCGRYP